MDRRCAPSFTQHRHCDTCSCQKAHLAGQAFRALRLYYGHTLDAVAAYTGFSEPDLSRFERGILKARPLVVALLFSALPDLPPTKGVPVPDTHRQGRFETVDHCRSCTCPVRRVVLASITNGDN